MNVPKKAVASKPKDAKANVNTPIKAVTTKLAAKKAATKPKVAKKPAAKKVTKASTAAPSGVGASVS